jgi:nitrate/TMAO reductase-like tetraheme cytochrome c subunit
MKAVSLFILIISIVLIQRSAFSEKAKTIDELVSMYDIQPCAECHEKNYEEWKTSTMGNSVIDPRVLRGMRTFIRLAIDEEDSLARKDLTICLNCHVPQIKDAAPELVLHIGDLVLTAVESSDLDQREAAKKELSKLNLNCLGCHNLRATGFDTRPEKGTIYVPREINTFAHEEAGFRTVKSDLLNTSEFCAQCHHCPPNVPWEECPTIYTSYIDDFKHKGRKETCQDCHMPESGHEDGEHEGRHRSHKFLGPKNPEFLRSAALLNVTTRSTRYIDIYENKKMPAIVVTTELTNKAGHVIPHGCSIMPKTVLNVSVKDWNGKEIFSRQKEYTVNDLYFKGGKKVAMAEWDITATEHFNLGLKPNAPDKITYVIPVKGDAEFVDVEASFSYMYSRGKTFIIDKVVKHVVIE